MVDGRLDHDGILAGTKWRILAQEPCSLVIEFACGELARYMNRGSGHEVCAQTLAENGRGRVYLGLHTWPPISRELSQEERDVLGRSEDAFVVKRTDEGVVLTGGSERATLYAVYGFLRKLGFAWLFPGPDGEVIPGAISMEAGCFSEIHEPAFSWRCLADNSLILPPCTWEAEMLELIDWAPKAGFNSLAFWFSGSLDRGYLNRLFDESRRRGLKTEIGSHLLNLFLARDLFDSEPELFRMKSGKRVQTGNFCGSNPKTIEILKKKVLDYVQEHPEVDVYHIWPDDSWDGSWCECPKCHGLPPFEQYMRVFSVLAEAVAGRWPEKKLTFLLYHDTVEIPEPGEPLPNALGLYCPRERCYRHTLSDAGCDRNRWFKNRRDTVPRYFGRNVYCFGYYGDLILFRNMAVPLVHVISSDSEECNDLGVESALMLVFGRYTSWAYPLNLYAFAVTTWDPGMSPDNVVDDYCRLAFGDAKTAMADYFRLLEEATGAMWSTCGYDTAKFCDLRNTPNDPVSYMKEHIELIAAALPGLARCRDALKTALGMPTETLQRRRIERESSMLEVTAVLAEALYHHMKAKLYATLSEAGRPLLKECHFECERALNLLKESLARVGSVSQDIKGDAGKAIFEDIVTDDLLASSRKMMEHAAGGDVEHS